MQGTYDLQIDAAPSDLTGDDGFNLVAEILEIDARTLTFAPTFAGMGPFSLVGNTLTITDANGQTEVLQATFAGNGNLLTLVDDIDGKAETFVYIRRDGGGRGNDLTLANLQGRYDLDVANTTFRRAVPLASGELEIAGHMVTASLTFTQTRAFTLAGSVITLTAADGERSVLQAELDRDGRILTLTVVEDQETFVYRRR